MIELFLDSQNPAAGSLFRHLVAHSGSRQMIVCHSQGNLVTSNALWGLQAAAGEAAFANLQVYSLASPFLAKPNREICRCNPNWAERYWPREPGLKWNWASRFIKDGGLLFRVESGTPADSFERFAQDCGILNASLKLLKPSGEGYAESLCEYSGLRPQISLQYPQSWEGDSRSELDGSTLRLTRQSATVDSGFLIVMAVEKNSRSSPAGLARRFANYLERDGFCLSGAPVVQGECHPNFSEASLYAPSMQRENREFIGAASILGNTKGDFLVGVVSPARRDSPWDWAVNKRCHEIVLDSIRCTDHMGESQIVTNF